MRLATQHPICWLVVLVPTPKELGVAGKISEGNFCGCNFPGHKKSFNQKKKTG